MMKIAEFKYLRKRNFNIMPKEVFSVNSDIFINFKAPELKNMPKDDFIVAWFDFYGFDCIKNKHHLNFYNRLCTVKLLDIKKIFNWAWAYYLEFDLSVERSIVDCIGYIQHHLGQGTWNAKTERQLMIRLMKKTSWYDGD